MPLYVTDCIWNRKEIKDLNSKNSYQQMVNQISELADQVEYMLSIKYQAQSSLVGQITQFKTEAIASTAIQGLEASFDVVVDEILRTYNHKADDHLKFEEMFALVKEMMPEIDMKFEADDDEIEAVVRNFDINGDGEYDRDEVQNFVRLMLKHGWVEG